MLELSKLASTAEKKGFSYMLAPEYYFFRDTVSQTAACALSTRTINIVSIFNPYTRHPSLIAMSLASLNEIAEGRIVGCLGASPSAWLSMMGIEQRLPLAALRESCQIIRQLLGGGRVTYRGKVFQVEGVELGFRTRPTLKIFFSVIGMKMLQLAGEVADGVILTACTPLSYISRAVENISEGAKRAGRNPNELEIAAAILYAPGKKYLLDAKKYAAYVISASNIGEYVLEEERVRKLQDLCIQERVEEAAALLSDDDMRAISLLGDAAECRRRLEEYLSAGVTLPILVPLGDPLEALEEASKLI